MSVVGDPFRASRASIQFRSSVYRDVEAQLNRNAVPEPVLVGEPEAVVTQSQFGDPGPLGLSAFALTTSVLSLINIQARGVTDPNIAVGLAFGYGGIASLIAGMWDFALGNTFGALVFTSYGGFWISFATIYIPAFNIGNASGYVNNPDEFMNAVGHYLIFWAVFTFLMTVGTIRSSITNFGLFITLGFTFLILAIGHYRGGDEVCLKMGGYFGLISASLGWYLVCAGIWNKGNSYITLPLGEFSWAEKTEDPQVSEPKRGVSFETSSYKSDDWSHPGGRPISEAKPKPRPDSIARPQSFGLPKDVVGRPKSLGLPPFYSYMYAHSRKV